jgi:hypothetical protein
MGGRLSVSGSKWAASTATVEGVSLFDVRGALKLAQGGQDKLPVQRSLPPPQMVMLGGVRLKLMPDYTPGRAIVWGTILSCWLVGGISAKVAQSMGIRTIADVRGTFSDAFSPGVAALRERLAPTKEALLSGEGSAIGALAAEMRVKLHRTMR